MGCAIGCGGDGVDAPFTASDDHCPELDEYLAPLVILADEGDLQSLRAVLAEDLSDDDRHDLVALILDLVRALDPGAVSGLADADLGTDQVADIEDTLAALSRWLAVEGPGAPYADTMAFAVAAINTCEGPPLFALVHELLVEEALLRSVLAAAGDPQLDLQGVLDGLDSPDGDPLAGLRALLSNLLTAATKPGFDVVEWTALLGLIDSLDTDRPPWSDLVAGLEAFLVPGPRLDALQDIVTCLLAVDPDLVWVDPLYDLLTAPPELAISLDDLAGGDDDSPLIPVALQQPVDAAIGFFREDASARQTLVRTLTALLEPDRAPKVLTDLAGLFEARVLVGLIEGLVAVATRSCGP